MSDVSTAILAVLAERRRQIDQEGWTEEHDDSHDRGEMAAAAACYALPEAARNWVLPRPSNGRLYQKIWPWDQKWWKPKTRRYDLVRAAALLIAEIERIDRARLDKLAS